MKFDTHILLAEHSSYKIGGPADYFCESKTIAELEEAVREARAKNLPIFILGGGTNLLFRDEGFRGLVIKPAIGGLTTKDSTIQAGAGVSMADLVHFSMKRGLSGLEWAGGLPGTVGGAVRGNAGAFGGEMKDAVVNVTSLVINRDEPAFIERKNAECRFGYRTSIFKEQGGNEIITSVILQLSPGDPEKIRIAIEEKIQYRRARHPLEYPNIGSIFKNVPLSQINADITQINADTIRVHPRTNPRTSAFAAPVKVDPFPVIPTAYLISEAGLKGISHGGAMVSPKHPNFIVNVLDARSSDVRHLIGLVKARVKEKFGIELEEEVLYI